MAGELIALRRMYYTNFDSFLNTRRCGSTLNLAIHPDPLPVLQDGGKRHEEYNY
jgi:hypothetical protein